MLEAERVACPACFAAPGEPCRAGQATVAAKATVHQARLRMAGIILRLQPEQLLAEHDPAPETAAERAEAEQLLAQHPPALPDEQADRLPWTSRPFDDGALGSKGWRP